MHDYHQILLFFYSFDLQKNTINLQFYFKEIAKLNCYVYFCRTVFLPLWEWVRGESSQGKDERRGDWVWRRGREWESPSSSSKAVVVDDPTKEKVDFPLSLLLTSSSAPFSSKNSAVFCASPSPFPPLSLFSLPDWEHRFYTSSSSALSLLWVNKMS